MTLHYLGRVIGIAIAKGKTFIQDIRGLANEATPNQEHQLPAPAGDLQSGIGQDHPSETQDRHQSSTREPHYPPVKKRSLVIRFIGVLRGYRTRTFVSDPKFWVEVLGIVILGIYTAYTARMYEANRRAADAAKSAADAAKLSADAVSTPWVGIEDNLLNIDRGPTFFWGFAPVLSKYPQISINVGFRIKNFGQAPAFSENHVVWVLPFDLPPFGGIPPTDQMDTACTFADMLTSKSGAAHPGAGQILLPGQTVPFRSNTSIVKLDQSKPRKIAILMAMVCIVYRDGKEQLRHSKYWYETVHGSDPYTDVVGHPEWSYLPILGVSLIGALTD